MASRVDVDRELGLEHSGRLLFSNPNNLHGRSRITNRASTDGGETWSAGERLDDGLGGGFPCMSMIGESTVGVLYEGSRAQMTYQRLPLSEFFGSDAPERPAGRHVPNTPSGNGFGQDNQP